MTGQRVVTDVVIGAGSGMGAAVSRLLAGSGRHLLLADRDPLAVADLAGGIAERFTGDVEPRTCDLTDPGAVAELVSGVEARGSLGALVITAGLSPHMGDGPTIVTVNLVATDAAVGAFEAIAAPGSVAVCFASMAAHLLPPDPTLDALLGDPSSPTLLDDLDAAGLLQHPGIAYAVSKRGVILLVQRRARAWGAAGARLVSVSPGIIDTPMGRLENANEPAIAGMVDGSALARQGRADEVAAVAAFLASDAASYVTGTDVLVDGGTVAAQRSAAGR